LALCAGITLSGSRCRAQAMRDSTYCLNHAPNAAELRKRRAWRGGKAGGKGRQNTQVQYVKEKILELTQKVEKGDVLRGDAAVMFQGYNVYLSALRTELRITEQQELLSRFEQLEEALTDNPNRYHHYGR
jgi:hypothetical protein